MYNVYYLKLELSENQVVQEYSHLKYNICQKNLL